MELTMHNLKTDYITKAGRISELEEENRRLKAENARLMKHRSEELSRRLKEISGEEETPRQAGRRGMIEGILIGTWAVAVIRMTIYILMEVLG